MASLIVGGEKTLTQLNPRLFRGRISSNARSAAIEAIRNANPHVDLDHLEPGTILTIPETPGVDVRNVSALDEISRRAIAEASSYLQTTLEEIAAADREERKNAKATRTSLRRTLTSRKLDGIRREDKSIKAMIDAAKEALDAEEERETEQRALAKKAMTQWSRDLAELRAKLPD